MFIIAAVFGWVCGYDFVNYDDSIHIYRNPNVQHGITLESVKWAFITGYAANWYPLTWLSHMLDWQLFGSNAGGHHFTNLLFHTANTLLLFLVLKRMTRGFWPSAFAAALFALHPLHVESVAWVSERKDVLSAFFWILTMWAYIYYAARPGTVRYLPVAVFFALALMSKPMAVTLPFVLLLLDYWPLNRFDQKQQMPNLFSEKIPLFIMSLVSCMITFAAQEESGTVHTGYNYSFPVRLANASISYLQYIIKMIWPAKLAFFYPHPRHSVSIQYAVISAIVLLAVTIFVCRFAKNHRYLVTGWFWYLGTFVPVIGFIQVGAQAMADRYSYIPLIGLFIIVAWGASRLLAGWRYQKTVLWVSSLVILAALSLCSYLQQRYWKDTITLCRHALDVTKNNYMAHFTMARELQDQGNINDAIRQYAQAVQIRPDDIDALNGLGSLLRIAGRIDEAINCYERVLAIDPHYIGANFNLGIAFATKRQFDEAVKFFSKALEIAPHSAEIRLYLGHALADSNKFADAEYEYGEVLRVQPQNIVACNALGTVLMREGKFDQAIEYFSQAVQIDPNYAAARRNLSLAQVKKQKAHDQDPNNLEK